MKNDEKWMEIAIQEAVKAKNAGEVPVGAVLIKNDNLVAKTFNQSISSYDPTAHAEIKVLRKAGEVLRNYRLTSTTLYVTLEPCAMCFGAMVHARIDRIVFGAYDPKTGVCGSCKNISHEEFFNHKIKIDGGILEKKCSNLIKKFFESLR